MSEVQLLHLIRWSDPRPPLLADLAVLHRAHLEKDLRELLWTAQLAGLGTYEQSRFDSCLLHPDLSRLLGMRALPLPTRLAEILELAQGGGASAHRLRCGIVVDFDSPMTRQSLDRSAVLNGPFTPYAESEQADICCKLDNAIETIAKVAPHAAAMISTCTRLIRVRKTAAPKVASEHLIVELGSIALGNPHRPELNAAFLMESLIHESMHNLLFMYERYLRPFADYEQRPERRPVSPWSGNAIPHEAFTHAVMVYYGATCFHRLAMQSLGSDIVGLEDRLRHCARGFRLGYKVTSRLEGVGRTRPEVLRLFDVMQSDVNAVFDGRELGVKRSIKQSLKGGGFDVRMAP